MPDIQRLPQTHWYGGGGHSVSSGAYNLHGGFACVNSGSYNNVGGYITQTTGSYCTNWGRENLVIADYSGAVGKKARTNKKGQQAQAAEASTSVGDAQTSVMTVFRVTTNATPAVLTTDGTAPSTTVNTIQISSTATNTWCATAYRITVIATKQGASTTDCGRWTFEGIMTKGANNASAAKAAGEVASTPQLVGLAGASAATSANTTSGLLDITVTGIAATNILWSARVELTEATYV